jgi:predicted aspartyl protease
MAYATVDFDAGVPYVGRRPMGMIMIAGPLRSRTLLALVDTGADYTHLPLELLDDVGLPLPAQRVRMMTAGGIIYMARGLFDVRVEGIPVRVPINVAPRARPLIGRQTLFALLDTSGFTPFEWLLDLKDTSLPPQQRSQAATGALTSDPSPSDEAPQVVDRGSWLDIGGVRVEKA